MTRAFGLGRMPGACNRISRTRTFQVGAMRRPRRQFTVRWLMVAVATLGLALGLAARRQRLLSMGTRHHRLMMRGAIKLTGRIGPDGRTGPFYRLTALGLWHWKIGQKYERAARCPWLPVELDSPEPE